MTLTVQSYCNEPPRTECRFQTLTVTPTPRSTSPPVVISLIYFQKSCNLDAVIRDAALHFTVRCKVKVNFGQHKDREKVGTVICGAAHLLQVTEMDTAVTANACSHVHAYTRAML